MSNHLTDREVQDQFHQLLTIIARPEITQLLETKFAYTTETRQTDQALLAQTQAAFQTQQKEQAQARAASLAEDQIQTTARAAFVQLHRLIRLTDKANPQQNLKHILQTQQLPKNETKFLTYTTALLARLQSEPEIITLLSRFGFTPQRLTELQTLIQNVQQADTTQQQEQSEAKQATQQYQELMAQLRLSHSILKTLAQEALADKPDLKKLLP